MFDIERMRLYLEFVEARHRIWGARQNGIPSRDWTSDPILASKKFTNVFRVLDPGSQFVLTDLADFPDERTVLMRLFLYRHTGRVEAWRHLQVDLGGYPQVDDLETVLESWHEYRGVVKESDRWLDPVVPGKKRRNSTPKTKYSFQRPIFTGAYLVFPQSQVPGTDKLESIIRLTQRLFTPGSPEDVVPDFLKASTQKERFAALRRNKGVADFMSMQILTDWGYLYGPDLENDFVVPGPGCRKGISCITDTPDQVAFLRFAREEVLAGDDVPMLSFENGQRRVPSIMDVQNTMCEFSKYVRYLSKGTTGFSPYQPAHPGQQPEPVLPSHWA